MPAEPKDQTREAMPAGLPDGATAHAAIGDAGGAAANDEKPAKPRKRACAADIRRRRDDRVFKFPSRTYPKSSYYVTSTEIIIRIRKARSGGSSCCPRSRSSRIGRIDGSPSRAGSRSIFELQQALRFGLVEQWVPPAETGAALPEGAPLAAPMPAGGDASAEPNFALADIASEEPAQEVELVEEAFDDEVVEKTASPTASFAANAPTHEKELGLGVQSTVVANDDIASPPPFAPVMPVRDWREASEHDEDDEDESSATPPPDRTHPRRPARAAWLGTSVLVLLLLTGSAIWWRIAGQAAPDATAMADGRPSEPSDRQAAAVGRPS